MIYKLDDNYFVRSLTLEDFDSEYISWFQNQDITFYNSHGKFFKTKEWFKSYYDELNIENKVVWAICERKAGHIGNISLSNISFINRNAELSIIIGNKSHWGKLVGFKAARKIIFHGFNKLNLKKIYLGTASSNKGMISLAKKIGMKKEGLRRNHIFLNGNWYDCEEFGILRDEFKYN